MPEGEIPNSNMLSRVRAKFYVQRFTKLAWGGFEIEMAAVYRKDDPENSKFWEATPTASLKMTLSAKADPAVARFYEEAVEHKREIYLDFTPSGEPVPGM